MADEGKPLSQWTNREWKGFLIALTFFGVFMAGLGIREANWDTTSLGLIFIAIGIGGAFVLHFFFGIKVLQIRTDMRYQKKQKRLE